MLIKCAVKSGYGWYVYDAHGDVVQICDDGGDVIRVYDYDPFGVEFGKDELDENPYRYCGEYYDRESGYTYLRARYYFAEIGRFVSEDPAFDGWNWYVYAGNNPVMFVDPTGLNIRLSSKNTDKQNQEILNNMQKITNYKLELDNSGKIQIAQSRDGSYLENIDNMDKKLGAGNTLVKRLIESKNTVDIRASGINNGKAAEDGSHILFNPKFSSHNNPSYIVLAHEMIHIDRIQRSQTLKGKAEYQSGKTLRIPTLSGRDLTFRFGVENSFIEEYATVGLGGYEYYVNGVSQKYWSNYGTPSYMLHGNITENHVRSEQGLPARKSYFKF